MGTEDPAAAAPATLADIISQLDDDQINELVATAEAAGFGEEPPSSAEDVNPDLEQPEAGTVDNDEALSEEGVDDSGSLAPSPEEAAEEEVDEEGAEEGDAELVEEKEAQGLDAIDSWASGILEDLDVQLDALKQHLATAEDNAEIGADPDSIEPLLDQAEELLEKASEAYSECKDAASAEDARSCALAGLRIERIHRVLLKLVEQAGAYAETSDAPEAGVMDDPAVKLWAERTGPKTGLL